MMMDCLSVATDSILAHTSTKTRIETGVLLMLLLDNFLILAHTSTKTRIETIPDFKT